MTNNSLGLNTLIASTDFAGISITDTDDTILPSPFLPAITLAEWKEGSLKQSWTVTLMAPPSIIFSFMISKLTVINKAFVQKHNMIDK